MSGNAEDSELHDHLLQLQTISHLPCSIRLLQIELGVFGCICSLIV